MPCQKTELSVYCKNSLVVFFFFVCQEGAADLQVTVGWRVVDLQVGVVGRGQLEAVFEPNHRGSGVSLHLTADVGRVSLPREHRHRAHDLRSVCSNTQGSKDGTHQNRRVWNNLLVI